MSDTFKVTATLDKPAYKAGETMTLRISGTATHDVTTTGTLAGSISIQAADGATETIPLPASTVEVTTSVPETFRIMGIADPPRVWTVSADGQSATAIA